MMCKPNFILIYSYLMMSSYTNPLTKAANLDMDSAGAVILLAENSPINI